MFGVSGRFRFRFRDSLVRTVQQLADLRDRPFDFLGVGEGEGEGGACICPRAELFYFWPTEGSVKAHVKARVKARIFFLRGNKSQHF